MVFNFVSDERFRKPVRENLIGGIWKKLGV